MGRSIVIGSVAMPSPILERKRTRRRSALFTAFIVVHAFDRSQQVLAFLLNSKRPRELWPGTYFTMRIRDAERDVLDGSKMERARRSRRSDRLHFLATLSMDVGDATVNNRHIHRLDMDVDSFRTGDLHDVHDVHMPSWLARYANNTFHCDAEASGKVGSIAMLNLKSALLVHPSSGDDSKKFSDDDVEDIIEALWNAARGDTNKFAGAADFLCLLLSVEADDHDSNDDMAGIVSRDALIASAFHYCDCVAARQSGFYDMFQDAMKKSNRGLRMNPGLAFDGARADSVMKLPPKQTNSLVGTTLTVSSIDRYDARTLDSGDDSPVLGSAKPTLGERQDEILPPAVTRDSNEARPYRGIEHFGGEAAKISTGAAEIKKVEMITDSVMGSRSPSLTVLPSPNLVVHPVRKENDRMLRCLLISASHDWRSLAIRSVACLYRLQGIWRFRCDTSSSERGGAMCPDSDNNTRQNGQNGSSRTFLSNGLTSEEVRVAREALNVYAPIAQRLGMQRLKSELESVAFRLLYPRQFAAAMKLYQNNLHALILVADITAAQMEDMFQEDEVLKRQRADVSVKSRVKEPFSLWKKVLKLRTKRMQHQKSPRLESPGQLLRAPNELSILDISDAVALRVVIRADKLVSSEEEDSVRARERMLCYYVQQLCVDRWPATDATRFKDYIKTPKRNGYQSLHYTATLGVLPFEIQVRTEEMHRIAEYGVAAHWEYKLNGSNHLLKGLSVDKAIEADSLHEHKPLSSRDLSEAGDHGAPLLLPPAKKSIATIPSGSEILKQQNVSDLDVTSEGNKSNSGVISERSLNPYLEALTVEKNSLSKENVFVFVSPLNEAMPGKILSLPMGSRVSDLIRESNRRYNVKRSDEEPNPLQVLRNGVKTNAMEELRNMDVVTIAIPE